MSGHSKWAQIKRKKAVTDAARSKVFGKLGRVLTIESKKAKGDQSVPTLRTAIEKAKAANMPKDNIERAVAKGMEAGAASLEPVLYETYGPGGVAILISALTDSTNRTAAEIKHLLSLHESSLASPGSAAWAFQKTAEGFQPNSTVDLTDEDGEKLATLVETLEEQDDVQDVFTNAA